MRMWTLQEAREKIQRELDMQGETFVAPDEWLEYFNEAIDEAEQDILNLHQEYFKKSSTISLVSGTSNYSLPADIYAHKIIHMQYDYGSHAYKIERVKPGNIADQNAIETNTNLHLQYEILNTDATTGPEIKYYPTPDTDETDAVTLHYIRNANRVTDDDSLIDLPEAMGFIFAFVKVSAAQKEVHPLLAKFESNLEKARVKLKQTLDNMTEDKEAIETDYSFYEDHY